MASARRTAGKLLDRLAFAHTLVGDPYKARAYKNAAWPIRSLEGDLAELLATGALKGKRGFGKGVMGVLQAAVDGVEPVGLAELEAKVPPGLFEVARIRGLGATKVRQLYESLAITDLSELEYACRENRLLALDGFGKGTQTKVLAEVQRLMSERGKFRRDHARALADALVAHLRPRCERVMVVGEMRRGCELVETLELLVVGDAELPPLPDGAPTVLLHRSNGADWGTLAVQHTGTAAHLDALGPLPVASSEAEVYRKLGFLVPAPEQRESSDLVRLGHAPVELVRREDLQGSLHNHTTYSDGADSLETMRDAALQAGLAYFAVTEHSQTANYARGLEPHRLADQVDEVRRLNEQGHGCMLLAGVESDILREGELDYTPEELAQLDLVVASIHNRFGLKGEAMTRRMANAAANPWVSIMGHPTGRLLLGRPPADYDVEAMLDNAAENGCAVELNASPARLDLNEEHLRMASERGLLVSIAADAHSARELDYLGYGVSIARRAGLRPDQVLNCMGLNELLRWLERRKQRALASPAP